MTMKISFLLGAGFSRPAGYPLAIDLSRKLLHVQSSGILVSSGGDAGLRPEFLAHIAATPDEPFIAPQDGGNMHNRPAADVLEAILKVYGTTHDLTQFPDYEDFYDELLRYYDKDPDALNNPLFQAECRNRNLHNDPERPVDSHHLDQAMSMAVRIFPQLLQQLLKADRAEASPGAGDAYSRFFDLLRTHSQRPRGFMISPPADHEFYLHTLNHDLFLENRFEGGDLREPIDYCDGFSELGSPYFGGVCFNETLPSPYNRRPFNAKVRMPLGLTHFTK